MISVIIPTFNRDETILRAVHSVLGQTYEDLELLVVDDGSTDQTLEKLDEIKDSRLKVFSIENSGVSSARNYAIEKSKREWLAFLDSDDEWLPKKLEKQIEFAKNNPHLHVIHTEEIWIRNGVRVNQMKKHQKFGGWIFQKCVPLCLISPSAVMIHQGVFNKVGVFDPEMIVCEDYDLWLRITKDHEVGFIEEPLIKKYGGHEDQLSRLYKAMDYYRVKAIHKVLPKLQGKDREVAENILKKKCEILLKGYEKHQNFENYQEVNQLRSLL